MTSIKVCKYFIKSSPVGELHEVLDDIAKVLGSSEFLASPDIKEALREYYESHKLHLHFANGQTVLVSAHGRQEPLVKYVQSENPVPVVAVTKAQPKAAAPKKGLFDGDDEDEYGAEKQVVEEEEQPAV